MSVLKSKKVLMQILALVVVAIVSAICDHYEVGSDTTAKILDWIFTLTGLGIVTHTATDVAAIMKGLAKKKEDS